MKTGLMAELVQKKKGVYMVNLHSKNPGELNGDILMLLASSKKTRGVCVILESDYALLQKKLKIFGIDLKKFYFIIGSRRGALKFQSGNCVPVSLPISLSEISLAIAEALKSKTFNFLFLDSLDSLIYNNDLASAQRFCHFLVNKLRDLGMGGIIVSRNESKKSIRLSQFLHQVCDNSIEIGADH